MSYKVAAYITSYEDTEALLKCISAIQKQSYEVQEILIVENSAIDNVSSLLIQNVTVKHYPENIGISGGLRVAILWAIQNRYDFLWTFDQDSEPLPDALEKLLYSYNILIEKEIKVGIVAPTVVDYHTQQKLHGIVFNGYRFTDAENCNQDQDFYECDAVITSGSLVYLDAAREADLPSEGLFIDAVDWDYCLKLKQKEYSTFVIRNSILKHRLGKSESANFPLLKKQIMIQHYSAIRYFYISRNHTYVETRLAATSGNLLMSLFHRARYLVIMTIKIVFYEPEGKAIKLWACYSGTLTGLIGKLGKAW